MGAIHIEEQVKGRERLLDAAQALFSEHGFTDVSINQIAQAAGMTRSAPYYHFKSKEELYAAVLARYFTGFFEQTKSRVAAAGSFREQLLAIMDVAMLAHGSSFARSKEDVRAHLSPEVRYAMLSQIPSPSELLNPVFQEAYETGVYSRTDPETAQRTFFMMMIGYREMSEKDHENTPRLFRVRPPDPEGFIDIFLLGI